MKFIKTISPGDDEAANASGIRDDEGVDETTTNSATAAHGGADEAASSSATADDEDAASTPIPNKRQG